MATQPGRGSKAKNTTTRTKKDKPLSTSYKEYMKSIGRPVPEKKGK